MKHPHLNLDPSLVKTAVPSTRYNGGVARFDCFRCPECQCVLPPAKSGEDLVCCPNCKTPCEIPAVGPAGTGA